MKPVMILLFMFFILLAGNVLGTNLYSEAGAGYDAPGNSFIGYGSNYKGLTGQNFSKCSLAGSSYNPLFIDNGGDTIPDIILYSGSSFYVYDSECSLKQYTNIGADITAMPNAINYDHDDDIELVFPTSYSVLLYEYSDDSETYYLSQNFTNLSITGTGLSGMVCEAIDSFCVLFKTNNRSVFFLNLSDGVIDRENNELDYAFKPITAMNGISISDSVTAGTYYIPVCQLNTAESIFKCQVLSVQNDGNFLLSTASYSHDFAGTGVVSDVSGNSVFIGKLGTAYKLFMSVVYFRSAPLSAYTHAFAVYDLLSGNEDIYDEIGLSIKGFYRSHPSVADIDKDGLNDVCYMSYDSISTFFKCYDSGLSLFIDINVTGEMHLNNFILADFDNTEPYLQIADYEGIFAINSLGDDINSTTSYYVGTGNGTASVVLQAASYSPMYSFTSNSLGYLVRNSLLGVLCGNGDCDSIENQFNCFADCNGTTTPGIEYDEGEAPVNTWVGFNKTKCASGYAEYGKCSLKPGGYSCVASSECLSSECVNSKCNSPGAWSSLDNFVKLSFGSDTTSLTFISIAIILILMGGIIFISKGSIAGIIAGTGVMIMAMIFFTIVGWLPVFFLLGLILLIVISIALLLVLR